MPGSKGRLEYRREEFREDWLAGVSLVVLTEKYGWQNVSSPSLAAKRMGLPRRPRGSKPRTLEREAEFIEDYNAGMTLTDMAAKYGFACSSGPCIRAKKLGLEPRQERNELKDGHWEKRRGVMVWVEG